MRLIGEMYQPTIAFLPIGDLYTMGPEQAAKACELLGVKQVVPMHYGTFPALTGTPAKLRELVEPKGVQVLELTPGETASREQHERVVTLSCLWRKLCWSYLVVIAMRQPSLVARSSSFRWCLP